MAERMTFDEDSLKYWTFIRAFDNNIDKYNVKEHANFARLLQHCKGRAYRVIESFAAIKTTSYARGRLLLRQRFDNEYAVTASWVNRVTAGARITSQPLQDFADEVLSFRETLSTIGCLLEINQRVL